MYERIQQSSKFLKDFCSVSPEVGIILGSGLGDLANHIEEAKAIPYSDIPNFPVSTVAGHKGNLVFGKLGGKQRMTVLAQLTRLRQICCDPRLCCEGYSGGSAKLEIQEGNVSVNGEVCTMRGKKLYPGDTFSYDGDTWCIHAAV